MDYLERLDKAVDSLEKEADKISGLSALAKAFGEAADELSAEKREVKDAIHTLKMWSEEQEQSIKRAVESVENGIRESKKKVDEVKNHFDTELQSIGKSIDEGKSELSIIKEELQNQQIKNEKTDRMHTILIAVAILASIISCCIPFIQ